MKRVMNRLYLMLILVALEFGMTSCDDVLNTVVPDNPVETETDPIAAWLSGIPGVSELQITQQKGENSNHDIIYYFNFEQPIDHKDPSKGSFKQRVAMKYRDPKAINILLTEGYSIPEDPDSIGDSGLSHMMLTNEITVEYRYFGTSLPEAFDNLDFTYLNSEQASDDLHAVVSALKQTGLFPQKWIATGVSKSGIASGLYAYYDEKKGYNDIDLYVPFCAPFCETLEDTRIGQYLETNSLAHYPEAKARHEAFVKSIFTNSYLGNYLNQKIQEEYPNFVAELKNSGMTDADTYWYVLNYCAVLNQNSQFLRTSYVPIEQWAGLIPSATASSTLELEWAYKFIKMNNNALTQELEDMQRSGTRVTMTDQERADLLNERAKDRTMPYCIQVMYELGSFGLTYDFLNGVEGAVPEYLQTLESQERVPFNYKMYAGRFDGAMTKDFVYNFLPKTSKKMIFVYGSQDPWTGAAIPDSKNPNVKKIVVPGGVHNDFLYLPQYYPIQSLEEIVGYINDFLQ